MIKKLLRYLSVILLALLILIILFVSVSVAPVDRTPVKEMEVYSRMMARLDSLEIDSPSGTGFAVGYSKVNLTPSYRTATAGYARRRGRLFSSIHDSIYVRTMVVRAGNHSVAIVSADLLIIPPTVTALLNEKLAETGFSLDNTYLGATHSHNSIGNWGYGATRFIYGAYDDSVVTFIADAIVESIYQASSSVTPARLRYGAIAVPDAVRNRVVNDGPEDPFLRVVEVSRADSTRLVLGSFTAHATCLYSRDLELSRDYPGKFVDLLEDRGYDFAMFMAGAVGSHRCDVPKFGWECIDWMGATLADALINHRGDLRVVDESGVCMERVQLILPDPQVKIAEGWKVRPWLFRQAFGEYPSFLTALRIGDLVMIGTPCDFSGEFDAALDSAATRLNARVMVTSFNGGYIGYLTPDRYYDVDHYETQLMNWYAPGTGEYVSSCIEKLMTGVMRP